MEKKLLEVQPLEEKMDLFVQKDCTGACNADCIIDTNVCDTHYVSVW